MHTKFSDKMTEIIALSMKNDFSVGIILLIQGYREMETKKKQRSKNTHF